MYAFVLISSRHKRNVASCTSVWVLPVGADLHWSLGQRSDPDYPGGGGVVLAAKGLRAEQGASGPVHGTCSTASQPGLREVSPQL